MTGYIQHLIQSLDFDAMANAFYRVAAVLICLTVHETCHGLTALALGDPTAKNRHRLSFNPLRHIDWLGLALMLTAGFGWAKPVPVDPRYFRHPKSGMALTAFAGPLSNMVLAALAMFFSRLIFQYAPENVVSEELFYFCLYRLAPLSIGLGVFNLLPFPPLDGSKIVAAVLPDHLYIIWMRYERYGMMVLMALILLGWWNGNFISAAVVRIYRFFAEIIFTGLL